MGRRMVLFDAREERARPLFSASAQAGLTAAEMLRRMLDHCLREDVLNQLVPAMSGGMTVGRRAD